MRWLRVGGRRFGKTAELDAARKLAGQRAAVGVNGWTCHVCHDYRPDERIGVHTTTVEVHGVEVRQNVRYCNDRPACVEGAAHVQFLSGD